MSNIINHPIYGAGIQVVDDTSLSGNAGDMINDNFYEIGNTLYTNTNNISSISGDLITISGLVGSVTGDYATGAELAIVSGDVVTVQNDISIVSGDLSITNAAVSSISGEVVGLGNDIVTVSGLIGEGSCTGYQALSEKDQPSGYPGLDADGYLTGPILARSLTIAELGAIIPQTGELVYSTDTKQFIVGDGDTLGGIPIPGISSANCVAVNGNMGTKYDMAVSLLDTYDVAKTFTPYGNSISSDNPMYVLLPPGIYDFGTGNRQLTVLQPDTEYIHFIGLCDDPTAVVLTSQHTGVAEVTGCGTVEQRANNIHYYNMTIQETRPTVSTFNAGASRQNGVRSLPAAWDYDGVYTGTKMHNVRLLAGFGEGSFGYPISLPSPNNMDMYGYFDNIYATEGFGYSDFSGTIMNSEFGNQVFYSPTGHLYGTIESSTFGNQCCNGYVHALVQDNVAGNNFIRYLESDGTSKRNTFGDDSILSFRGTSEYDVGGDRCFGYNNCGGILYRARGGFACLISSILGMSGTIENSKFKSIGDSLTIASSYGILRNTVITDQINPIMTWGGIIDGCSIRHTGTSYCGIYMIEGGRVYNTLLVTDSPAGISGEGCNVSVAHCTMNSDLWNVNNHISTPYNVIDTGVVW